MKLKVEEVKDDEAEETEKEEEVKERVQDLDDYEKMSDSTWKGRRELREETKWVRNKAWK